VGAIGHLSGGLQWFLSSPDVRCRIPVALSEDRSHSLIVHRTVSAAVGLEPLVSCADFPRIQSILAAKVPSIRPSITSGTALILCQFREFARSLTGNIGIQVPSLGSDRPGWPDWGSHSPSVFSLTVVFLTFRGTGRLSCFGSLAAVGTLGFALGVGTFASTMLVDGLRTCDGTPGHVVPPVLHFPSGQTILLQYISSWLPLRLPFSNLKLKQMMRTRSKTGVRKIAPFQKEDDPRDFFLDPAIILATRRPWASRHNMNRNYFCEKLWKRKHIWTYSVYNYIYYIWQIFYRARKIKSNIVWFYNIFKIGEKHFRFQCDDFYIYFYAK